jgi:hypothetical protein
MTFFYSEDIANFSKTSFLLARDGQFIKNFLARRRWRIYQKLFFYLQEMTNWSKNFFYSQEMANWYKNFFLLAGDGQMVESELWQIPGPLVQAEIQAAAGQEKEREGQKGQRDSQKGEGGAKGKMWLFFAVFQCCGSGMFIPDPNLFHPGSRIQIFSIPVTGLKKFKYFNPKAFGNMIHVHPGSGSWFFFTHPGSRIQASKKAPDPGFVSATQLFSCTQVLVMIQPFFHVALLIAAVSCSVKCAVSSCR